MTKEIIDAINNKGYTCKDEDNNELRIKVIGKLLKNPDCNSQYILRGLIEGNGKVEWGSDADKAMHPFVEMAKMYLCYDIEKLKTILFLSWLREQGWLQNPHQSNEQMIDEYLKSKL